MPVTRWGGSDRATTRAIRRVFARVLTLMAVGLAALTAYEDAQLTFMTVPVRMVVFACLATIVVRAARGHVGSVEVSLLGIATVAQVFGPGQEPSTWSASTTTTVTAFCLASVSVLSPPLGIVVALGTSVALMAPRFFSARGVEALGTTAMNLALVLAASAFVDWTLTRAARLDQLAADDEAGSHERLTSFAQRRGAAEAMGILHDHVITALRAVQDHAYHHDAESVRRACARAVSALDSGRHPDHHDTSSLVSQVSADAPVAVEVDVEPLALDGLEASPDAVREAFRGAFGEALRNVHRHAGVTSAGLSLRRVGEQIVGEVSDRGRGALRLDPGYGIEHSIRRRMTMVGGQAEVESTRDGTTVRLIWPSRAASSHESGAHETLASLTQRFALPQQSLIWWIIAPLLSAHVLLAILYVADSRMPLLGVATALALAAISLMLGWTAGRRPLTQLATNAIALTTLALVVTFLLVEGATTLRGLESWPVGFASLPLTVLAFQNRLSTLVVTALPGPLALLALTAATEGVAIAEITGSLLPFSFVAVGGCLGFLIRSQMVSEQRSREDLARRQFEQITPRLLEAERTRHLSHTRTVVRPWLAAMASGQLAPHDPEIQIRARLLAQEVRDDLYAPGFIDTELRAAITAYRRTGGAVDLRPGSGRTTPGQVRRFVVRLIARFPGRRITVTPQGDDAYRIVVTPGADPDDLTRTLAGFQPRVVHNDEFVSEVVLDTLPDQGMVPTPATGRS